MDRPVKGAPAREAAAYVAELAADLARIAREHHLDTLCFLLEMARMEARNIAEHISNPSDGRFT